MPAMNNKSPESIIKKGMAELSLSPSPAQISSFMLYLSELKKWNRAYNLTGLKTDEEIVVKHFLDSLLYLEALPDGEVSVMDVGSGAGFPGIPIKIMRPEITLYLIEPSRKKATFLTHVIRTLGLDRIEVIEKRIEEVKSMTVDVAVTRALMGVSEFYKKASRCLEEGGILILNKGPKVYEELKAFNDARFELLTLKLPCSNARRFIIVLRKALNGEAEREVDFQPTKNRQATTNICFNAECRLRRAGCRGFEGCPGFMGRS